jgi:hypothetical protein
LLYKIAWDPAPGDFLFGMGGKSKRQAKFLPGVAP